jgi:hypothetical protein
VRRVSRALRVLAGAAMMWLLGGGGALAQALPFTVFTSRAGWESAAGIVTTIDFEGIAANGSFTAFDTAQGYSRFGLRLVGQSPGNAAVPYYLRAVSPTFATDYNWGSGAVMHGPPIVIQNTNVGGPNSAIVITPPTDVYAMGGDIMTVFPQGQNVTVQVRTTSGVYPVPAFTAVRPTRTFVGVVSPERILEVRIFSFGFPVIDNLAFSANALAPGTPTSLTATAVGSTVTISWNAPVTGGAPSQYELLASATPGGAPIASLGTANTSLSVADVPNGTYYLRVRAANAVGQSPLTGEVRVTVGTPAGLLTLAPAGPVTLGQSVTLSWQSTPVAASYTLTVLGGPGIGGPTTVAAAGCCSTSLVIPLSVAPGTYSIVVSGGGVTSAPIGLQVLPAAPFALSLSRASARVGETVTLAWTDLGLGSGVQYQLFAAPSGSTAFAPVAPASCCGLTVTIPTGASGAYDLVVRGSNTRQSNVMTLQITP